MISQQKDFFLTLLFLYFCIISVQVLCNKVRGEGRPKYDFVLYGGGGVWRGAKLYYIILEWSLIVVDILTNSSTVLGQYEALGLGAKL